MELSCLLMDIPLDLIEKCTLSLFLYLCRDKFKSLFENAKSAIDRWIVDDEWWLDTYSLC
jgi:hypothetical protein